MARERMVSGGTRHHVLTALTRTDRRPLLVITPRCRRAGRSYCRIRLADPRTARPGSVSARRCPSTSRQSQALPFHDECRHRCRFRRLSWFSHTATTDTARLACSDGYPPGAELVFIGYPRQPAGTDRAWTRRSRGASGRLQTDNWKMRRAWTARPHAGYHVAGQSGTAHGPSDRGCGRILPG